MLRSELQEGLVGAILKDSSCTLQQVSYSRQGQSTPLSFALVLLSQAVLAAGHPVMLAVCYIYRK